MIYLFLLFVIIFYFLCKEKLFFIVMFIFRVFFVIA